MGDKKRGMFDPGSPKTPKMFKCGFQGMLSRDVDPNSKAEVYLSYQNGICKIPQNQLGYNNLQYLGNGSDK